MGGKEKKRSKKASSQVRKKMRHRSRSRKRSSKKMRRPEDSYSESDDESRSLASSSSEEDGKRRGSKSRARKDGKAHKRRARSSSSGSDGSFDSPRAKKRKRSKRKVEGGRKKTGRKSRRAVSESDESDYEKPRGSSKKKELSRRYGKKDSTKERKRYRSPSVSTSSGASEKERKRKRYQSPSRSSLSVSSESENRTKRKRYWSPSGSLLSGSHDQRIENEIVEVQNKPARKLSSIIVFPKETDLLTMRGEHEKDYGRRDEYGERSSKSNLIETGDQINESRIEDSVLVRDNQELESILRLKALENLKKFRGPEKAEKSDKAEIRVEVVKQLPEPEILSDQERIDDHRMKLSFSSDKDPGLIIDDSSKDVDQASTLKKEEGLTTPSGSIENVSEPFQLSLDPPADKKSNIRDDRRITVSQPGQSDPLLASQEPPAACFTKEPKLSPPEPLGATPELDRCSSYKSGSMATDEVKPKSFSDNIKEANTAATSASDNQPSPATAAGEHHAELKESSQFQEKTMSVMRGGELVQVSYKVYIPKKAPAVARRRLKR
uniref:Uncharacterized protein n=1 Tax=Kalanchoe fedtschenkoi TaxID=63787 RepID=A0A7N0RG24_KALFE